MKRNKRLIFLGTSLMLFSGFLSASILKNNDITPVKAASNDVFNLSSVEVSCEGSGTLSVNVPSSFTGFDRSFEIDYVYGEEGCHFEYCVSNVSQQVNRDGSLNYDYSLSITNVTLNGDDNSLLISSIYVCTYTNFVTDDKTDTNYYEPLQICTYPEFNANYSGTVSQLTNRKGNTHGDNSPVLWLTSSLAISAPDRTNEDLSIRYIYEISSFTGTINDGNSGVASTIAVVILGPAAVAGAIMAGAGLSGRNGFSSSGMSFDADGDIRVVDPITNKTDIYVSNSDGTYTNPVTGVTATKEEIEANQSFKHEHFDELKQEHEKDKVFNEKNRERNKELNDKSDYDALVEQQKHDEYVDEIKEKHHLSDDMSEVAVKNELIHEQELNKIQSERYMEESQELSDAIEANENIERAADDFFAAVENDPTGVGKVGSAAYKATKDIVSTMAEKGVTAEAALEGTIKAVTDASTTMMDSSVGKVATTFVGTTAAETVSQLAEGKEIGDAIRGASDKGLAEAAYTAVSEAADKVIPQNPVSKGIKGVVDNEYHSQVVEPGIEENLNKK